MVCVLLVAPTPAPPSETAVRPTPLSSRNMEVIKSLCLLDAHMVLDVTEVGDSFVMWTFGEGGAGLAEGRGRNPLCKPL